MRTEFYLVAAKLRTLAELIEAEIDEGNSASTPDIHTLDKDGEFVRWGLSVHERRGGGGYSFRATGIEVYDIIQVAVKVTR